MDDFIEGSTSKGKFIENHLGKATPQLIYKKIEGNRHKGRLQRHDLGAGEDGRKRMVN